MQFDAKTACCAALTGGLLAAVSAHASGPNRDGWQQRGIATFYSHYFDGRRTASGERYDPWAMTAANPSLPLGTRVRVSRDDGRSIVVRINDREPHNGRRIIDLSRAAARALGVGGIATVTLSRVGPETPDGAPVEVAEAPDRPVAHRRPLMLAPPPIAAPRDRPRRPPVFQSALGGR
jgi:rare lipoprotein A